MFKIEKAVGKTRSRGIRELRTEIISTASKLKCGECFTVAYSNASYASGLLDGSMPDRRFSVSRIDASKKSIRVLRNA